MLILLAGRDRNAASIRTVALVGACSACSSRFRSAPASTRATADLQFVEKAAWIERLNAHYHLGVDGISVWFVLLTAFITVIVVIAGWEVIESRVAQYYAAFLILSGLMIGVFAARRRPAVLRVLRGHADPDVHHHRHLGRTEPGLRGVQVLPVHAAGSLLMLVALVYLYTVSGGSSRSSTGTRRRSA